MYGLQDHLKNVLGGKTATALSKAFGMVTVEDLLHHFPRRYAERGQLTEMSSLPLEEHVTIMADILTVTRRAMKSRKGSLLEVQVTDGTGSLKLTFFNQDWREKDLRVGRRGLFSGKVTSFQNQRQLAHPTYVLVPNSTEPDPEAIAAFSKAMIPVYPATSAVTSWMIERSVELILDGLDPLIKDVLPADVIEKENFLTLVEAFEKIHRPQNQSDVAQARERFAYEEAFVYQTIMAQRRADAEAALATPRVRGTEGILAAFDQQLPFTLTDGQVAVCEEIFEDLATPHPMHRLLQGEVGSGKTICALRAMLAVVQAGGQAALLAPTEVLATQHHRSIVGMLGDLADNTGLFSGRHAHATSVRLLTGSSNSASRREALLDAASGAAGILIGTHALLEDRVQFADLGLVVVDEQHRFGVEQRAALTRKSPEGVRPHVLVMTATPIPRTVAMTVFGDLEISTLTQLPAGRSPIATHVVPVAEKPQFLDRAWARIREEIAAGHQAYVVCPRITPTDKNGEGDSEDFIETESSQNNIASVVEVAEMLTAGPLFGIRVGVLHGALPADEKDRVMQAFARREIDVLIATTVIEVGVDVPNSTVMVIMDADRFGVSQLHQLRGRVGRGTAAGLCLLVTNSVEGSPARRRLDAVAATTDGFELSRFDLEIRREGDVLGNAQSGRRSSLAVLNVVRDEDIITRARETATMLVARDPELRESTALSTRIRKVLDDERASYLEKS